MITRARSGVTLALTAVIAAVGCAGALRGSSDEPTVELVVHNERSGGVTAYVQWEGLRPTRLGVISAGRSTTYLPGFREGLGLCVLITEVGNTSFSTAVPEREPPNRCQSGVPVERGRRMDVVLYQDRICYVQYDPDC